MPSFLYLFKKSLATRLFVVIVCITVIHEKTDLKFLEGMRGCKCYVLFHVSRHVRFLGCYHTEQFF